MSDNIGFSVIDPSGLIEADLGATIIQGFHDETEPLRDEMLKFLIDATPMDTGALKEDMSGTFNRNAGDDTLITLVAGTESQITEWGRVYVLYNEGPWHGLGLSSPTIDPNNNPNGNPNTYRNMFFNTAREHLDYVGEWATGAANKGLQNIVDGRSLRI